MQYFVFENHQNKCRCCFKPLNTVRVALQNNRKSLESMIGFELSTKSDSSMFMCLNCVNKLKEYNQFKTRAKNLQDLYTKFLSGQPIIKIENETEYSTVTEVIDQKNQIERVDVVEVPELLDEIKLEFDEDACRKSWNISECWVKLERISIPTTGKLKPPATKLPPVSFPLSHLKSLTVRRIPPPKQKVATKQQDDVEPSIIELDTFNCNHCQLSFTAQANLDAHIESSHPSRFACMEDGCKATFTFKECHTKHMQSHQQSPDITTTSPNLQCDLCGYKCKQKFQIKNHIMAIHDTNLTSYDCDICEFSTYSRLILEDHTASHQKKRRQPGQGDLLELKKKKIKRNRQSKAYIKLHPEVLALRVPYEIRNASKICDLCGISYTDKRRLKDHMEVNHSNELRYQCSQCDHKTTSLGNVYAHFHQHHSNEKRMCQICGDFFASSSSLRSHIQNRHVMSHVKDEQGSTCQICNLVYSSPGVLKMHMLQVHSDLKPEFQCEQCPRKFFTEKKLANHVRNGHGHHPCDYENCDMVFTRRFAKVKHISQVHELDTDKLNENLCHTCGRSYINETALRTHIEDMHENKGAHQCHICGKALNSKYQLRNHIVVKHTGIRKHDCETCGKLFATSTDLKMHVTFVHMGEKRKLKTKIWTYSCEICPPGATLWRSSDSLKNHMLLMHSESQQEHECEFCEKKFLLKRRLYDHRINMHSEGLINLQCELCGKDVKNRGVLRRHIRTVHEGLVFKCTLCSTTFRDKMRAKIFRHYSSKHSMKRGKQLEKIFMNMKRERLN